MNGPMLSRILTGFMIIGVGVAFLLRQLGVEPFDSLDIGQIIGTYWPVILLVIGLQGLLSRTRGTDDWWGIVLIVVGFVFLGRNLGWIEWSIGEIISHAWPIVIIIIGVRYMMKPRHTKVEGPKEDWESFRPYSADEPIPPAPPLHPDPTLQADRDTPRPPAPPVPPTEQDKGFNGPYQHPYYDKKVEEQRRKEERRHAKRHGWHSHHNRVEWWNSDPNVQTKSGFIGDIYLGHDYWELKPMNISHFIGDTVLDLTKAQISEGETRVIISSFIGDVKVFVPNDRDVGVTVTSSSFIGDVKVLDQQDSGLFKNIQVNSPHYYEADKKIKIIVSTFIGDVRVTKVG
ncbi:cell wall-active antibiotics response protein LiaF [Paenibacillus sp. GCM10023252]|uniref:cell wall-active antibiotics response protein LiaF n=1 Tax=Paenibacillus sp. GCM10023252 TaxID=3252649 RepID=UPI00361951C3